MIKAVQAPKYRQDIDGLRAIAVLSVVFFHFGFLPYGYLGVDVFFVISGYLITGIIFQELQEDRFSIREFYLRRTRRILPLALFICAVALALGMVVMLPDDLENLAQSVVATNFFGNNILQAVTTKDYWDVVNEYKPLMHTWSLGVEEQYYFVYPFLLLLVYRIRRPLLQPTLILFGLLSLALFLIPTFADYQKFYLIPFRFWELALGGVVAIYLSRRVIQCGLSSFLPVIIISLMVLGLGPVGDQYLLILVVFITALVLASDNYSKSIFNQILLNKYAVFIGKISFSIYMWHQVLLAYARYFMFPKLAPAHLAVILVCTILLSILTYLFVEQPFRNKNKVNNRTLLISIATVFCVTTSLSLLIHFRGGVIRDIPELDIQFADAMPKIHAKYNAQIYAYDKGFAHDGKTKVLVLGNSFARDWANVLLETRFSRDLDISYIFNVGAHPELLVRADQADVIFYSTPEITLVDELGLPSEKIWAIGTKNFGKSNGIHYNHRGDDYYFQRTYMEGRYTEMNQMLRDQWGERYLDYISKIIDTNGRVPVFTPQRKFISQDCRHLTRAGARYFAGLFDTELMQIFEGLSGENSESL